MKQTTTHAIPSVVFGIVATFLTLMVFPVTTHAQFDGEFFDSPCCDGGSYVDSIDWGYNSSNPSYVDSIDWGYDSYNSSYVDSIDWGYNSSNPSYVDSIDWGYDSYNPSYVDSIDWGYNSSNPSYVDSIDWGYDSYNSSYVDSIDWGYNSSNPSYVDSIDYSYPASTPSYVSSIDYSYPVSSQTYGGGYTQSSTNRGVSYSQPTYYGGGSQNSAPVYRTTPQPPVVYQPPQQPPVQPPVQRPNPTCQIFQALASGNNQVTLSWSSQNAMSASLSNVGTVAVNGSRIVNAGTVSMTYVLTVQNGYGQSGNCQVVIQPIQHQAPSCQIFQALASGGVNNQVYLSWSSQNAVSASLSNVGAVPVNGSRTVYGNNGTMTYVLTVQNGYGQSANCQVIVQGTYVPPVIPAPYCSITLNSYGYNQATLSWSATGATYATINNIGTVSTYGSQTVYPGNGTIYTMTVTGQGGTATCQTQSYYYNPPVVNPPVIYPPVVNPPVIYPPVINPPVIYPPVVNPPVINPSTLACQIAGNRSSIQNGQSVVLAWASSGALTARLNDGLGNVNTVGTITVRPESSRTYVLTVSDAYGRTATCQANVSVNSPSQYVSLSQIPYTGFDFGPLGNALYWFALLAFAVSAAYLVVYGEVTKTIATSLRSATVPLPRMRSVPVTQKAVMEPTIISETVIPKVTEVVAPVVASVDFLPTMQSAPVRATKDTMTFAQGNSPRIVINRV